MCTMIAKYHSSCTACGRSIRAGDKIDYNKATGSRHISCGAAKPARQQPGPSKPAPRARTERAAPVRREPAPGEQIVERRAQGRDDLYEVGCTRHMPKVQGSGGGTDGHYWTVLSTWYSPRCEDNQQFDALACAIVRPATEAEAALVAAKVAAKALHADLVRDLRASPAERVSIQMPDAAVVLVPRNPTRMCASGERVAISDDGALLHERVGDPDMCDSIYHYVVRITDPSSDLVSRVAAFIAAAGGAS